MPFFALTGRDVVYEDGGQSPIIAKVIIRSNDRVLLIFAFARERFSNFTCEVRQGETMYLRGTYYSFDSFEEAVLKLQLNQKEVMLTT